MVSTGKTLTAHELYLLTSSQDMESRVTALETASMLLTEQQQMAASAQLCFQWLASVVEEQAKAEGGAIEEGEADAEQDTMLWAEGLR
eukprot:gene20808-27643_t